MRFERTRFFLLFAACAALFACGKRSDDVAAKLPPAAQPTTVQSPLVGSEAAPSLKAMHDTVYARASRGDTLGLLRLFVRDSLYRAAVWPTQPSYEPDRDEVWNLVSGMNKANSSKGLRRLLGELDAEPRPLPPLPTFSATEIEGGVIYGSTKADRKRGEFWLFAAALCLKGECRVMTYAEAGLQGNREEN